MRSAYLLDTVSIAAVEKRRWANGTRWGYDVLDVKLGQWNYQPPPQHRYPGVARHLCRLQPQSCVFYKAGQAQNALSPREI